MALAEHFHCTRQAIIRQFIRQCPVESFPEGWVAADTQLTDERVDHVNQIINQIIAEQLQRLEEVP